MRFSFFCSSNSPAIKHYNRGIVVTMSCYLLAVVATAFIVHRYHPHGPLIFLLCFIPSACIFAMLGVVVRYLRDEKDEYQRMLAVRSLLCAAFAVLGLSAYTDFLRSFGNLPGLPPFAEFVAFWFIFGIAQAVQNLASKGGENE
jgi:hypothetical protein